MYALTGLQMTNIQNGVLNLQIVKTVNNIMMAQILTLNVLVNWVTRALQQMVLLATSMQVLPAQTGQLAL